MRLPPHLIAAALLACTALPAPAAPGDDVSPTMPLSRPIDMMVDDAARLADEAAAREGTLTPAADATEAEKALGLFQRGRYIAALAAAEKLADDGDGAMAALAAHIHAEGLGTKRDGDLALEWLRRAADLGEPSARHAVAIRLIEGRGVARDEAKGRAMLGALVREGVAAAANDLAQLVLARAGDDRAFEDGQRLLEHAARGGMVDAQYALARMIAARTDDPDAEDPEGMLADALEWLVQSARSGLPEAQLELGVWLVTGRAGTRDLEAAFGWIERAALAGLPLARNRLARMHWEGLGTPGDRLAAARWHALARMGGVDDPALDQLLAGLTREEAETAMRGLPAAARSMPVLASAPPKRIEFRNEASDNALPGVTLLGVSRDRRVKLVDPGTE